MKIQDILVEKEKLDLVEVQILNVNTFLLPLLKQI